jgi:hypothetical protein
VCQFVSKYETESAAILRLIAGLYGRRFGIAWAARMEEFLADFEGVTRPQAEEEPAHCSPRVIAITAAVVTPCLAAPRARPNQSSQAGGVARRCRSVSSHCASTSTCGPGNFSIAASISAMVLIAWDFTMAMPASAISSFPASGSQESSAEAFTDRRSTPGQPCLNPLHRPKPAAVVGPRRGSAVSRLLPPAGRAILAICLSSRRIT